VRTSLILIVEQGAKFLIILVRYNGAGCKLDRQVCSLYTGRVRNSLRFLSGGVRTSQGKRKVKGLSFGLDNIQICNIFLVRHLIQDRNVFQWLEVGVCTQGQI
jgi:hypothetical protein